MKMMTKIEALRLAEAHDVEKMLATTDKPSLKALSYALRHPETWPKDFGWDFNNCDTCAMGLAMQLWEADKEIKDEWPLAGEWMLENFEIQEDAIDEIFFGSGKWVPTRTISEGHLWWRTSWKVSDMGLVTPEMVADQIDLYLENCSVE